MERSGHLFDLAMNSLANFIYSHSLEVTFPKESSQAFSRAIEVERDKLKKNKHSFLPALALALALVLKALLSAKLALGLVLYIALQFLLSKKKGIK